jgi:tRNA(fMet)-specific endonuclease VapC
MRYLLDTSIVSAPIAKTPNPHIVAALELKSHECVIAAPVWHELRFGCLRLPKGSRRELLANYLESVVHTTLAVLPYDEVAAEWHARERQRLESMGRPAPYVDGQIAAIACVNKLTLVTTNSKDFAQYQGLSIEDWSQPRAKRR